MMNSYWTSENGVIKTQTLDYGDGNGIYIVYNTDGSVFSSESINLPISDPEPLDPHGQLVTLLVVTGNLNIDDAEHVAGSGITAQDLVNEALAWSLG